MIPSEIFFILSLAHLRTIVSEHKGRENRYQFQEKTYSFPDTVRVSSGPFS